MADGRVGAVVVGTGFGVLTHVRAMQRAGIDVVALVGRDREKATHRASIFGVPHVGTSLAEVLGLDGVDAVAVTTPPASHCALVLEAVAAGKHVVCEKPFALDTAQARAMLEAAERAGVVHLLGTEFRFAPAQAQLSRLVAAGAIGDPTLALLALQIPTLADPTAVIPAWWEDASQGGGWLGAQGSHVIDQVRSTLGEFEAVSATLQTLAPRPTMTADDTFTVQFRLVGGATGAMLGSCATPGPFFAVTRVSGSQASAWIEADHVVVDGAHGSRRYDPDADLVGGPPEPPPSELLVTAYDMWHSTGIDLHPYTRLYRVFADRILGRAVAAHPVAATFADGVAVQAVMDAVHRSSRERRWVEVGA